MLRFTFVWQKLFARFGLHGDGKCRRCSSGGTACSAGGGRHCGLAELHLPQEGKSEYLFRYGGGDDQRNLLLHAFGHETGEINLRIHRKNIVCPECLASFLRGAFLCCGTVTDPNKEYHLEFVVPYSNLAKDLLVALQMCGVERLQPGLTNRRGSFVVYSKGMEQVTDLLTYLGAPAAAMELMQVKMLKEVRNQINRRTNFETANLDKTASAAARQVLAIQKIAESTGLGELPEELRELAELRLQNPEMSLRELGESLSPPLSRSGVNHRLQRIVDLAETLPER